ncbi:MAG: beta-propeller fold lactonase family protein [Verrucomicrobia bacterium]|nr:beta-propeller fold lactonase family protein [Verrucomicrobiota bacterium]MBV8485198.1 beta-propeller fold lactonase family protein [Verrucomicrobiota bacterium]
MTEKFKQQTLVNLVGFRLVLAMGLSGSIMIASSGLAQPADSIGVAARPPKNSVIITVGVGTRPMGIVVSPNNKTVFVANSGSNSVSVLDASNNYTVKATVSVGANPGYLAISPDGKTLYVSCNGSPGSVYAIDTTQSDYPVKATLTAGDTPAGMAVTPNGKKLYVANEGNQSTGIAGTVSVFDTSNGTLKTTLQPEGAPFLVVFTEQGTQADLLNTAGTSYLQFINTVSSKVSRSTGGGEAVFLATGMTSDPSGSTLYITTTENYLTLCNAKTGKVTKQILVSPSIAAGNQLGEPAVTPDGRYVYVPYNYNAADELLNQVGMFDIATGKIVGSPVAVGSYPFWAQMAPNGETLYVANQFDGTVTVIDTRP